MSSLLVTPPRKYRFVRDVGVSDWPSFRRSFKAGEILNVYMGDTYGIISNDEIFFNKEMVALENPEALGTFFTCPLDFLERVV